MYKPGEKEPYNPDLYCQQPVTDRLIEVLHKQGYGSLVYSYDARSGWMYLSNIDVGKEFRGHGVGKNLVRYSKELAGELGAKLVFSAVTSREAYDVVAAIYGEESIKAAQLGPYMKPDEDWPEFGSTSATLWYEPNAVKD